LGRTSITFQGRLLVQAVSRNRRSRKRCMVNEAKTKLTYRKTP
jgi:hypothetical protein